MKRLNSKRILVPGLVIGIIFIAWISWLVGAGRLGGERDELFNRREVYIKAMEAVRAQRKERPELDERENAIIARTFGGDYEKVDSRIRERLYALGATAGLSELVVQTAGSTSRQSPAKTEFDRRGQQKKLRDETDFVEVTATISGEGSLPQVLRLLGWLDADGWIKRVTQVRFDPNPDGTRIRLSARIMTIFLPGRQPESVPPAGELDEGRLGQLVAVNPFRVPPPPPPPEPEKTPKPKPEPAVVQAPTPPPPGFPYEKWVLTGVAIGPDGPEAWLRNSTANKRKTLRPGGAIGEAVLLQIEGEDAIFQLGDAKFGVRIGRSLAAGRDTSL